MKFAGTFRLGVNLILLLGLALRTFMLDAVPFDYDRSYPAGVAVALRDAIFAGRFADVALHGQMQSLGIANPVLANYVFLPVAILCDHPYAYTAISAMTSVLVIALSYGIARRFVAPQSAQIAALLVAISPWSIYYGRGAWQLGLFEASVVICAAMFMAGGAKVSGQLTRAVVVTASLAHIYTVGFGLFAGAISVLFVRRKMKHAGFALIAFSISAACYAWVVLANDTGFLANPQVNIAYSAAQQDTLPGGVPVPRALMPLVRALGLPAGFAFEAILMPEVPDVAHGLPLAASQLRVAVVMVATAAGLLLMLRNPCRNAMPLMWFGAPVLLITAATLISARLPANMYYMLLTAPTCSVFAGHAAWLLLRRLPKSAHLALAGVVAGSALFSTVELAKMYSAQPAHDLVLNLPVREQLKLRTAILESCTELDGQIDPFETRLDLKWWKYALIGNTHRVIPDADARLQGANSYRALATGGTCMLRTPGQMPPPEGMAQQIATIRDVRLFQSAQIDESDPGIVLGNGLRFSRELVTRGAEVGISHVWLVPDDFRSENTRERYDLFVKVQARDGTVIAQGDAASVPYRSLRPGDVLLLSVNLKLPPGTSGDFDLVQSYYDRGTGKNTVFLQNGMAQVERKIRITLP